MIGRGPVRVEHLEKLDYINAVLRETLRLTPTAPAMTKQIVPNFKGKPHYVKGSMSSSQMIESLLC